MRLAEFRDEVDALLRACDSYQSASGTGSGHAGNTLNNEASIVSKRALDLHGEVIPSRATNRDREKLQLAMERARAIAVSANLGHRLHVVLDQVQRPRCFVPYKSRRHHGGGRNAAGSAGHIRSVEGTRRRLERARAAVKF